jgi:peptidyl-prolyl cis-trans isomerase C
MKLLHEPLVHFLVIGAALFALYSFVGQPDADGQERSIVITAGEIAWLTDSWEKRWHRPPTAEEREGLIDHYLREMILYREAVAMGLDRDDIIIRRRLAQKLEFLSQDLINPQPPTEQELRTYFQSNVEHYEAPSLVTINHVFVDPDLHGKQALAVAGEITELLQSKGDLPQDIKAYGDPFLRQSYYQERTKDELSQLFGDDFAKEVFELELQQWHGPVQSGYGIHVVYVHELQKAVPPEFADIEEQVLQDWENNQREVLNKQFVDSLIARYDVVIENGTDGMETGVPQVRAQ